MAFRLHLFPDLTLLVFSAAIQLILSWWIWNNPKWATLGRRVLLALANLAVGGLLVFTYLLGFHRVWRRVPMIWGTWTEAIGITVEMALLGLFAGMLVWRSAPKFQPKRRRFVQGAGAAVMAAPFVAAGFGIAARNRFELNVVDIPVPNLPPDLQGLRIVQISDIHLSPFLSEREFARAIDMANEAKPHLTLVTGDLITRTGDPLDACLRQLARLRADAGILGCHGNHEDYCGIKDYVTEQGRRIGIDFLRSRSRVLQFGNAKINFAGVDYQRFHHPYLVGAERMVEPGVLNVLLSHNPDVFPLAAEQGYDVTIAGHTHGGQVNFEILHSELNVARYFTRYVLGLYRRGNASAYVSSGLGTIGVPVRIGAPPEVAVLRLCAI
jgi:predicted MPP superfamily phosphohydrolase